MFTNNKILLSEIKKLISFDLIKDAEISFVGKLDLRHQEMKNTLVFCNNDGFLLKALKLNSVSAVVVGDKSLVKLASSYKKGIIFDKNPKEMLNHIQNYISKIEGFQWKSFNSRIADSAKIHPSAQIANSNVIIGDNTTISANVCVNERTIIGKNCTLKEGVVLGTDAFEVYGDDENRSIASQSGGVKINDNVSIQALCSIIRASFGGFTTLGKNTKLDANIHVAHDCIISENVSIAASAMLAGNVKIGKNTFIGPSSSISNGVSIGEKCWITIGSNVVRDVKDNSRVTGNFAVDHGLFIKNLKKSL